MGPTVWLILLVAAGAFILLNLLRNQEEARRRQRSMQGNMGRGPEENPDRKRQPPVTDLDRFLQEVHRRRRVAEGEEPERQPAPRATAQAGRPRRSPSTPRAAPSPGQRLARSGQKPTSRQPSTTPVAAEVIPLAIAVEEPGSRSWARSGPEPSATLFPAAAQALPSVAAVQSVEATRRPTGRSNSFFALLTSREGLRNALIVREILNPPVCKRRRGRGMV